MTRARSARLVHMAIILAVCGATIAAEVSSVWKVRKKKHLFYRFFFSILDLHIHKYANIFALRSNYG